MANDCRPWVPDAPVSPGETIREILEERAISQVDFATRLGRSEKFVSQLINGKASLTYDTAIDLERVLGVPATFWNRAEATYRGLLAQKARLAASEEQAEWVRSFPVKDMADKGLIAREATAAEQAEELLSFFGVSSIDAYRDYWSAEKRLAARMSTAYTPDIPAITAWLRAGEREAELIETAPYDEGRFRSVLDELRHATRLLPREWQPLVVSRCAAAGVAVVFVPDLPKTRYHAASWWTGRTRAVIQLGSFYRTDDQVWFSLFHEAAHLLLDRSRSRISDLDGNSETEQKMSEFAGDLLIPAEEYRAFVSGGRPSKTEVVAFAERIGIAPSIVVGRLQRDRVIPYNWMNDLKTKLDWAAQRERPIGR